MSDRWSKLRGLCAVMLLFIGKTAAAALLAVGPGKRFDRIEQAVAVATPGDEIEVYPPADGQAYERVAVLVNKPRLTIRAAGIEAGRRIKLSGRGLEYSGSGSTPRAIFQFDPGADYCVLEGFELTGATNKTRNGAGVRINQANHVRIRDCDIHHNDMGIMSNGNGTSGSAVNQRIEYCTIHHNGNPESPRFHHNLYLGGTSVTLRFCEVHHGWRGHNVKSRAHFTRVEYSYVHHSANREFDLVDAEDTSRPGAHAVLLGNIIDDGGTRRNNQILGVGRRGGASAARIRGFGNWLAPGFRAGLEQTSLDPRDNTIAERSQRLFIDPRQHDYRLRETWPGIVAAGLPVNRLQLPRTPGARREDPPLRWQYVHPLSRGSRGPSERPDLGAQKFSGRPEGRP